MSGSTELAFIEHEFRLPLDYGRPTLGEITVFVREVSVSQEPSRPFLVYFRGGPGIESDRPTRNPVSPSWLGRALREYRVLFLDYRGTGRSTPVGDLSGMSPNEQADYLASFRADAIVRDAESIRGVLGVESWSVLGQSFGGFCVVNYLSQAPQGLRQAFIAGGLPPLGRHPDEVYQATYARILERVRRYYREYPRRPPPGA